MTRLTITQLTKPVYRTNLTAIERLVKSFLHLDVEMQPILELSPSSYHFVFLNPADLKDEYWKNQIEAAHDLCYVGFYSYMLALLAKGVLRPGYYVIGAH